MKVYNEQQNNLLRPALLRALSALREHQRFDAHRYIEKKAKVLSDYLRQSKLSSCVVAVSGGIDSAVVLGIAARAKQLPGSPLKRVIPVMLPVFESGGATNQDSATAKGIEVTRAFGLEPIVLPLTNAHGALKSAVDTALNQHGDNWAAGQLVSYLRTPALYYITSLLSEAGMPGILLGTTNRDEGAYLGYFGKASDGLVDVQVISDIYKSQVFSVGEALGVPEATLTAVPTGDMYDGRVDEEVFGAPYAFVELFLRFKQLSEAARVQLCSDWKDGDRSQFDELATRLENMHRYNAHKYMGKSPAVHLDLWDCRINGGWDYSVFEAA